jgi:hypothetical protein
MGRAAFALRAVIAVSMTAVLIGCTTTDQSYPSASVANDAPAPKTAMQRAVANCFMTVGLGAVAGAVIGAAFGRNNAGAGAIVGAGVGAGACAALVKVAAAEDQAHMRDLERQAVAANVSQTQAFTTTRGSYAQVTTVVTAAPLPPPKPAQVASASQTFTDCRYSSQSIQVDMQSANVDKQLWCRVETGDWQPVTS